jgi:hypothetical protein
MSLTPEQLDRLPKYAQARINYLELELERARAKIQEGPEVSTATLDPYHDTNRRELGRNTHIQFRSDNGARWDLRHDAAKDTLKISGNGDHYRDVFVVLPDASNAVILTLHRVEK